MTCPSHIRRYINSLPENQIFTTRDCLVFGKRQCVDKALQAMVLSNFITRLTSGVFVRPSGNFLMPTHREIAMIKARAFKKDLRLHGQDTAAETGLSPEFNEEPTFYVDGSSSSFFYNKKRVHLKKASKKRLAMEDSRAGLAIRALWAMGERQVTSREVDKISHYWHSNRDELEKIRLAKAWMPSWLGDYFQPSNFNKRTSYSVEIQEPSKRLTVKCPVGSYDSQTKNYRPRIRFSIETARVSSFGLPIWSKTLTELSVLTRPS